MSSKAIKIVSLPGDGIGPEVCREALRVLERAVARAGRTLDAGDEALPERTRIAAQQADAVLLGAVGLPKYDGQPGNRRPEKGLLDLRKALGVYANLRPVRAVPALASFSPLKAELLDGVDLIVVRELLGDVYFGEPRGIEGDRAYNTMVYTKAEVRRVAKLAFELARRRRNHVYSIDKANVLEVSQLWRATVNELHRESYSDVKLEHQYVDSAAMDLVKNPKKFDVIVTGNLFGDILSDQASMCVGSIGLLASASLSEGTMGLYEPIHGSAPDIAGQGLANPMATILSAAMLLRHSFGLEAQAARIEAAVAKALADGLRGGDLGGTDGTVAIGDAVLARL